MTTIWQIIVHWRLTALLAVVTVAATIAAGVVQAPLEDHAAPVSPPTVVVTATATATVKVPIPSSTPTPTDVAVPTPVPSLTSVPSAVPTPSPFSSSPPASSPTAQPTSRNHANGLRDACLVQRHYLIRQPCKSVKTLLQLELII